MVLPVVISSAGVREGNVVQDRMRVERSIRGTVVHIVALNPFIHDAEPTADNRLALAGEVIGKSDTRSESCPVILDQTLRNTVHTTDPDAVLIEL